MTTPQLHNAPPQLHNAPPQLHNAHIYDIPLALRHRSRWEAVDAGILLWRDNFAFLLLFFALPLWLCAFGLRIIPERIRYVSWIALWLLRPLFERSALHVISVRFFEKGAGLGRLCKGFFKTITRALAADLSWRRFSPLRAAMLPVRTLEVLPFRQIKERRRILKKGGLGFCSVLTSWALGMEIVLLTGELAFFMISLEILQPGLFTSIQDMVDGWEIYIYAAWCVNSMLIGSLYVCMGFSLYINSRIELEGWDMEITFKALAEKSKLKKNIQTAALAIFLATGLLLPQRNVSAETINNNFFSSEAVPMEVLQEILASPDFGGERDSWSIRLKNQKEKETPDFNFNFNPWLEIIKQAFAYILRLALICLIVLTAILIFHYVRKFRGGKTIFNMRRSLRTVQRSEDAEPAALLAQSRSHFSRGELRLAWGLCIAALFRTLTLHHGIAFQPGATEYDCLSAARSCGQDRKLAVPVNHWIQFAYGGQIPPEDSYHEAVAYCMSLAHPAPDAAVPGTAADSQDAVTRNREANG